MIAGHTYGFHEYKNNVTYSKFLYALEAVLDIAINSQGKPIQGHEITKRQSIPKRYLENILQELVRNNILKGIRGPKGGYTIAKEKRNILLIDIYNVILSMEEKGTYSNRQTDIRAKIIMPLISDISNKLIILLKSKTLEDLYLKIKYIKLDNNKKKDKKIDFSI